MKHTASATEPTIGLTWHWGKGTTGSAVAHGHLGPETFTVNLSWALTPSATPQALMGYGVAAYVSIGPSSPFLTVSAQRCHKRAEPFS